MLSDMQLGNHAGSLVLLTHTRPDSESVHSDFGALYIINHLLTYLLTILACDERQTDGQTSISTTAIGLSVAT